MATLLAATDEGIEESARRLREGRLVAFPTETVYGLGANALNERAVRDIFAVKGRPLTDPLIVHVGGLEEALALVHVDGIGRLAFEALASAFWPGGLTLIARARSHLPRCLSAGTGSVGVRVPSHPLALKLIRAARVPVAAPSANRFGHVSPTKAQHVISDLGHSPIAVLDGDGDAVETCKHGIESTVCKVDAEAGELLIYRRGAIPEADIRRTLQEAGLACLKITIVQKHLPLIHPEPNATAVGTGPNATGGAVKRKAGELSIDEADAHTAADVGDSVGAVRPRVSGPDLAVSADQRKPTQHQEEEEVGAEAPGQLITHYAPDVPTFMIRVVAPSDASSAASEPEAAPEVAEADRPAALEALRKTVVIDLGATLLGLKGEALAYRDLAPNRDTQTAARALFDTLRWAEAVPEASRVLIVHVESAAAPGDEYAGSLADRAYRAASGRVMLLAAGEGALPPLAVSEEESR